MVGWEGEAGVVHRLAIVESWRKPFLGFGVLFGK